MESGWRSIHIGDVQASHACIMTIGRAILLCRDCENHGE